MNQETNDFLKYNLDEAHSTFVSIISEMKDNNIDFSYDVLEEMEKNSYEEVMKQLGKMNYYVIESYDLLEDNNELINKEFGLYVKYISLYIVSLLFIRIYHEVFDTSKLNDMVKFFIGMFLGSTYMMLLNRDINDNKSDTKEKRDMINKLKTMKEEYKKMHDQVVHEIDSMFAINSGLWMKLDEAKMKKYKTTF